MAGGLVKNNEGLVREYFRAVDTFDFDRLEGVLCEDVTLKYPARSQVVGREDVLTFYRAALEKYARGIDHVRKLYFSDDGGVVAHIFFEAQLKSGEDVAFEAYDVFSFRGSKIASIEVNFDSKSVFEAITPPPAAGGET